MEITIGNYRIYPLDRLNWVVDRCTESMDEETGESTVSWNRQNKYFARIQYAAEYVYDQILRDSNGKFDLAAANAADVAELAEQTMLRLIEAINDMQPEDQQVDIDDYRVRVTLADPDSFKKRRRRKKTASN